MKPVNCTKCERTLLDHHEGILRIRAKIILIDMSNERMTAMCPQCKQFMMIPLAVRWLD